jgi:hypothetical protein
MATFLLEKRPWKQKGHLQMKEGADRSCVASARVLEGSDVCSYKPIIVLINVHECLLYAR